MKNILNLNIKTILRDFLRNNKKRVLFGALFGSLVLPLMKVLNPNRIILTDLFLEFLEFLAEVSFEVICFPYDFSEFVSWNTGLFHWFFFYPHNHPLRIFFFTVFVWVVNVVVVGFLYDRYVKRSGKDEV